MSKVEGRGPIDSPLCLRVTFSRVKRLIISKTNREEVLKIRTKIKTIENKISGISQKLKNSIQFISDKYNLLLAKEQTSRKRITDLADLSNCLI